jgi:DNA-directed RNA polymerase specialized sigma24 family protein
VARAKRELLLRAHRFRLRREDLEDCYSQATLELIAQARAGVTFSSSRHAANVLEQRFVSRIHDRRRALSGRSPMQAAMEQSASLDSAGEERVDVADARAELERLVIVRDELRRIQAVAHGLSYEQRLVIATQIGLEMGCGEFCRIYGWTPERYRKVAQRARARLRRLMDEEQIVPSLPRESEGKPGTAYDHLSPHS